MAIRICYWALQMCHDLLKVIMVLDILFRFLPRITFLVDHFCVMLRVVIQKILLFLTLLLCYFNRSATIYFTHRALRNVCLQTPTPSFHAARWSWKNKGMWDVVLSMLQTFSLMQELLEYLICFKPLWRVPFILFVISGFNYSRKRS